MNKEMTKEAQRELTLSIFVSQAFILQIDAFEKLHPNFRHRLKERATMIIKQSKKLLFLLEPTVDFVFRNNKSGEDIEQFIEGAEMFLKMARCTSELEPIHMAGFNNDVKALFEKYHVSKETIKKVFEI